MSYNYLPLDRKWLSFQQVKNLLDYDQQVSITFDAHERILKCRQYVDTVLESSSARYPGINMGLLNGQQVEQLQYNLLKSQACGMGEEVSTDIVKLMLMLKIKSLSYGNSGVQIDTVKRLMEMYNNAVLPVIYSQGSSGAGGDTTALSHLSLPLIGLGEVYYKGQKRASSEVLAELNWQPLTLHSKEALALITGTQFTTACGIFALKKTEQLLKFADVIAALSLDAFDCSIGSLHEKLHSVRSHQGQVNTAAAILKYLKGSPVASQEKQRADDPYSFRCIPQVHGATKDTFEYVLNVFLKEINAVTDNPHIFPDEDLVLSGGNFHEQPLALALDFLAIGMCGLADISERRTSQLLSGQRGLPLFLTKSAEVNSGLNGLHAAAAGLVAENKQLAAPASIHNIPGSNNEEDYLTGGANAATKSLRLIDNVEKVLAIELIVAAAAFECRRPVQSVAFLEQLVRDLRQYVSPVGEEHVLHDEIIKASRFMQSRRL